MKTQYLLIVAFIALYSCNCPVENNSKEEEKSTVPLVKVDFPKNQILTAAQQIKAALYAAPQQVRENAKVYGYDANQDFVVLREGTNNFICIADNPKKDGFQVVAYPTNLDPLMARGRTLNKEGKSRQEKEKIRSSEAKNGTLALPKNPSTLHIFYGKQGYFNTKTDSIENTKYRYVVYIPYATQETTGLSLSPNGSSHPWLMFPGKYNAHIMITPTE